MQLGLKRRRPCAACVLCACRWHLPRSPSALKCSRWTAAAVAVGLVCSKKYLAHLQEQPLLGQVCGGSVADVYVPSTRSSMRLESPGVKAAPSSTISKVGAACSAANLPDPVLFWLGSCLAQLGMSSSRICCARCMVCPTPSCPRRSCRDTWHACSLTHQARPLTVSCCLTSLPLLPCLQVQSSGTKARASARPTRSPLARLSPASFLSNSPALSPSQAHVSCRLRLGRSRATCLVSRLALQRLPALCISSTTVSNALCPMLNAWSYAAGPPLRPQCEAKAPPPLPCDSPGGRIIPAPPARVSCLPLVWARGTAALSGLQRHLGPMLQLLCSPCLPQPDASMPAPRLSAVLCLLQAPSLGSSVGGGSLAGADRPLQRGSPASPLQVRLPPHAHAAHPPIDCPATAVAPQCQVLVALLGGPPPSGRSSGSHNVLP